MLEIRHSHDSTCKSASIEARRIVSHGLGR